jgi:hypothetical protein
MTTDFGFAMCIRVEVGKKVKNKNFIFIPNHHFWMSEGSLNNE